MGEADARVRSGVTDVPVRDAATLILVRDPATAPRILMGQRGKAAAFMADKFVFPGGAVDAADAVREVALCSHCRTKLEAKSDLPAGAIAAAALRELYEETGQRLNDTAPGLHFFFRAVTPPGRPRRFDARFFLADAVHLSSDPDRFEPVEAELSHLQWVPLGEVRQLDLPFITRIVLAELEQHLPRVDAPERVPFVRNDDPMSDVVWL
ncbi:MAG: NUDIX hydrolase [Silicimonas sp.]|nr:NUDIX hydrolase [Silicimonas sp.]